VSDTMISLLLPPLLLVPLMGMLSQGAGNGVLTAELRRKALHISVGLAALGFPLCLDTPARVVIALGLVLAWMAAVRGMPGLRRRFGRCLFDAARLSHGELYFALAIGLLLLVAANALLYVIPVLILTFADAAAAIVGRAAATRGGRLARPLINGKTAAGSAAFLVLAFSVTAPVLMLSPDVQPTVAVALAFLIATATTIVELFSRGGADNLLIPASAFLLLQTGLPAAATTPAVALSLEFSTLFAGV
jgi:phytol kinase